LDEGRVDFNAVVTQRIEVAPGLFVLDVAPLGWELPEFEPGQYAVIGLPGSAPRCRDAEPEDHPAEPDKLIKRAYSIASRSQAKQYLESWELGYREEMMTLQRFCREFQYLPIVSRPQEEPIPWAGLAGHCQDVWRRRVIDQVWGFSARPETTHIFLCGNPAMIQDMIALLTAEGFREHSRRSPGQIHTEKYW
jgi:NAD(P)H-flavin reductase